MLHIKADVSVRRTMIRRYIESQQDTERKMADGIVDVFNSNYDLLDALKGMVYNALDDIEWMMENLDNGEGVVKEAFRGDAVHYGFVSKQNKKGLRDKYTEDNFVQEVRQRLPSMKAPECSDLIRFYGEVIERGAKRPALAVPPKYADEDGKDTRPAVPDRKGQTTRLGSDVVKLNERRVGYQKDTVGGKWWVKIEEDPTGRRLRTKTGKLSDLERQAYQRRLNRIEKLVRDQTKGGLTRWKQLDMDLVRRLDLVFGLSLGATISGTTTDTIFFINRMSLIDEALKPDGTAHNYYFTGTGPKGLDPIYYMLPLATIVSEGHHTTIEVALPLALNGIVTDYKIGMYESLMPERAGRVNAGASPIMAHLRQSQLQSRHFLVYYEGRDIGGCVMFESPDMRIWEEVALVNEQLMIKVNGFGPQPTRDDIASLHPAVAEALNH
jgi:hypothetical protein